MKENYSQKTNEEILTILTGEKTMTEDAFCYGLIYLFEKNKNVAVMNDLKDITTNIFQITKQNDLNSLNLITFILSFFNIVKL